MQEQLQNDINRILKEKFNINHSVKVTNVITVGANRTCSVIVGKNWQFDGIVYESLNGRAMFEYRPEDVAELMVDKIHRFKKYSK